MKARGLITEIEVPATWDDSGTTRQTSAEYPFVYKDPVSQTGTYTALRVDWGDGTSNDYTTGTYHTHSYTSSGRFTVKYSSSNGVLPNMSWGVQSGSPKQLKKIKYANFTAGSLAPSFHNWTASYACNLEYLTYDYFRHYCSSNTFLSYLMRSQTSSYGSTIRNETLKHNTHVTNISYLLFRSTITSIPSKIFKNLSSVTDCSSIFNKCTNITSIPEGLFDDVISVTNFIGVFASTGITNVHAGLFTNNTEVTSFLSAFANCTALQSVDYGMFTTCTKAVNFGDPSYLTSGTFMNCTSLTTRPPKLPTSAVCVRGCFLGCSNMTGNADELWNEAEYPNINNYASCFSGCTHLTNYADIPSGWK